MKSMPEEACRGSDQLYIGILRESAPCHSDNGARANPAEDKRDHGSKKAAGMEFWQHFQVNMSHMRCAVTVSVAE